jgi:hypothetical protein
MGACATLPPTQHLEAVLKVVFPAVAILLEFQLSGTR